MVRILVLASALAAPVQAQNTFEDSKGITAIQVFDRRVGDVAFNALENSIELKVGAYSFDSGFLDWYSIGTKAKAKNGVANVLANGNVAPEATAELSIGMNVLTSEATLDPAEIARLMSEPNAQDLIAAYVKSTPSRSAYGVWFVTRGSLTGGKYRIFTGTADFGDQIETENFFGMEATFGLNAWHANVLGNRIVAGGTVGIRRENNAGSLRERTVDDVTTYTSSDGRTERSVKESRTALVGTYEETTAFPLDLDLVVAPQFIPAVALNGYTRTGLGEDGQTRAGFGFSILKSENPLTPLGGITFEVSDIFNQGDDVPFSERVSINLIVNVPIPRVR
ncbi:MAG TPA: hypothetical protein VEQ60_32535 [Longimicrobium sp.]|nr:hypothetical protein [Longimicrobium sp.]